ncbi:hypothetical protein Dimus_011363 [Dionaea muscipula]
MSGWCPQFWWLAGFVSGGFCYHCDECHIKRCIGTRNEDEFIVAAFSMGVDERLVWSSVEMIGSILGGRGCLICARMWCAVTWGVLLDDRGLKYYDCCTMNVVECYCEVPRVIHKSSEDVLTTLDLVMIPCDYCFSVWRLSVGS